MILFLIIIALCYLVVASVQDLRKREVENWISFSLIAFALAYRAFFSFEYGCWFFLYGLIGLGIFIGLGFLLYYSRLFAGGDAKLLMALGAVIPLSFSLFENLYSLGIYVFCFLAAGAFFGIVFSIGLIVRNRKRFFIEIKKQNERYGAIKYYLILAAFVSLTIPLITGEFIFLFVPVLIFILPFLFIFGKAVEEGCMIKEVSPEKLTLGDWLYESVKVGKKMVEPNWEGLDEKELTLLRKLKRKVLVKQGIPFVPAFLIGFVLFLLWKAYWGF